MMVRPLVTLALSAVTLVLTCRIYYLRATGYKETLVSFPALILVFGLSVHEALWAVGVADTPLAFTSWRGAIPIMLLLDMVIIKAYRLWKNPGRQS